MASKKTTTWLRYAGVIAGCWAAGLAVSWLPLAERIDNVAYDWMSSRAKAAWETHSVVVGVDKRTFEARHGMPNLRPILAEALDKINQAKPAGVAIDVILHDEVDEEKDARLEAALRATRNLVLPCEVEQDGSWEDPLPRFQTSIPDDLGHVQLEPNPVDGETREIPVEQVASGHRRWALSLRALSLLRGQPVMDSMNDVQVGSEIIPVPRGTRVLQIRYLPDGRIPILSALDIDQNTEDHNRAALAGKFVFLGVTDYSAARDRVINPYGEAVGGVVAHAQAFETLVHGEFLTKADESERLLVCLGLAALAGLTFALLSGWPSYALGAAVIVAAHYVPILFFRNNVIFPYSAPMAVAWLCCAGAATYQHFFVRRQLKRSESERSRYQQAIHWAAHEMRTPLTAIQGSSEIMTRYALPEEKRNQLNEMIHSESKRLARIIQTFLDVERLADGQMEMKRERFAASDIVTTCLNRVRPLAERKQIEMILEEDPQGDFLGDRELMEYAFYNLLTNAVKYSPAGTQVRVFSEQRGGELRLAVQDQGIGMDAREQKNIFKKFYRTKSAEASGEVGTGIGLSIVEQIITHHGGRIDVASEPGKGSCFTMVLRTQASGRG